MRYTFFTAAFDGLSVGRACRPVLCRISNKGMEGLAITPDGKTLAGIMQANLEQDNVNSLRIITIDSRTGRTNQYAYQLADG